MASEVELTSDDLSIIYRRSAVAAFLASTAGDLRQLPALPEGTSPQDFGDAPINLSSRKVM